MSCLWHVLCLVCGMFYGLNWEDILAGGKGLFSGWFWVKAACTEATKSSLARYCVAGLEIAASGTQLHGFPHNFVAPVHFQTSNIKWSYLSRPNFDSYVLRLYGKLFESKI